MKKTLVGLLIVSLLATSLFAAPKKAKKAKKGKNKAMNISVFTIQQRILQKSKVIPLYYATIV